MSAMNRTRFPKELQRGLKSVFGLEYKRYPEEWRKAFEVDMTDQSYDEEQLVTGFGSAVVKAEGDEFTYDSGGEAWTARYIIDTIALGFFFTEEAAEDNLYMKLGPKYSKALARSMQYTKEIRGANVFNNGFSSSYKGGDGVELFSLAHPTRSGANQANELATAADLSQTSLEDMLTLIRKCEDDRGIPAMLNPKALIVPPELDWVANKIIQTPKAIGSNNNDVNLLSTRGYFSGGACLMTNLTDPDAWFVTTDVMDGLKYKDRVKMAIRSFQDDNTGNWHFVARERYKFGWTDWRGAFGTPGA